MGKPEKYPSPGPEWEAEFKEVMKDSFLKKKYNREQRIAAKKKYIDENCAEIKAVKGKTVLDIGPGPGEFLEWCRHYGHKVMGIDGKETGSEMGDHYLKLSILMTKRQKINVAYCGFEEYLKEKECGIPCVTVESKGYAEFVNIPSESAFWINLQGSLEQCLRDYLDGSPHRQHHTASRLLWKVDDPATWDVFYKMFTEFARILEPGGYVLIWGNGSANNPIYDNYVLETLKKIPALKLLKKKGKTFHKIRKVV